MDGLIRDVRFGLRNLLRNPGLALVIALSLALGIGANTAIFSIIRAVLFSSLPVRDPQHLVLLNWHGDTWPKGLNQSGSGGPPGYDVGSRSLPFPLIREISAQTSMFDSVFAFAPLGAERQNVTLAADDGAERVDGEMVSGEYFRGLGTSPALGRLLTGTDEQSGAHVLVLSYPYWKRRFAADPTVVGRAVTLNHLPFTIVGVTTPGFFGVEPGRVPDLWVPMMNDSTLVPWGYRPPEGLDLLAARGYWWAQAMARLAPGVDERQALASADAAFQAFVPDALPEADRSKLPHIGFEPGAGGLDILRSTYEKPLQVLMAMVGLVLLIACANVAVLLLSRAMSRRREFALRLSLGAARIRLIRQLLTESLLMALIGGLLGIVCAGWTARALLFLVPPERRPFLDYQVDGATLLFAGVVSVLTAIVFGLAPALVATRLELLPAMKQVQAGAVMSDPPTQRTWSSAFVIVQIALSLVLLVTAALFVRTLTNLQRQSLGVDDHNLLVFGVDGSQNGYEGTRLATLYATITRRLDALPGVENASASRLRLFSGWVSTGTVSMPGVERKPSMNMNENAVGPAFAATTGMRVLVGRDLRGATSKGAAAWRSSPRKPRATSSATSTSSVASIRGRTPSTPAKPSRSSASSRMRSIRRCAAPSRGRRTCRFTAMRGELHGLFFAVRTTGDPLALATAARNAVQSVDSSLAVVQMDSMANQVGDSLWQERLFARLTTAFSALALTLACIGLYGTISYGVGRRRAEIALRMALGAQRPQVQWLVLRRAVLLAVAGVALGVPIAFRAGTLVSAFLFGLTPNDPTTFAASALTLVGVASLAGYLPARRASLVDPAVALKAD